MKHLVSSIVGMGILAATCGFAEAASVNSFHFSDFSSGNLAHLQLNGSAAGAVASDGHDVVRLTPAQTWQTGGAFLKDPVVLTGDASFSTFFSFQFSAPGGSFDSDGVGADGMVFILHTDLDAVGANGGGIGYGNINPSVGIEFDTFLNPGDINGNHVGINVGGSLQSVAAAPVGPTPRLNDGDIWYAWIDYDGATELLEVRLSLTSTRPTDALLSHSINLGATLNLVDSGLSAYTGFTAGTGTAYNNHDLRSWSFTNVYDPTFTVVPLPTSAGAGLILLIGLGASRLRRPRTDAS